MTCGHCVASVTEEVREIPGVDDRRRRPRDRGAHRHQRARPSTTAAVRDSRRRGRLPAGMKAHGMNRTPLRVAGFLAGLAAVFGIALGVGTHGRAGRPSSEPRVRATAPDDDTSPRASRCRHPGRTRWSRRRLHVPARRHLGPAGTQTCPSRSRSTGRTASRSRTYDVEHEKRLHLIVVRRDFTGFQHVHPDARERRHLVDRPSTSRPASGGCSPTSQPAGRGAHARRRPRGSGRATSRSPADGRDPHRRRSTATPSTLDGDLIAGERRDADAERRARTAGRSPTSSRTSAPTATWSRCARATSPTCTCTRTASPATAHRARAGRRVRRRGPERRRLPPVPRLQARRRRPDRRSSPSAASAPRPPAPTRTRGGSGR